MSKGVPEASELLYEEDKQKIKQGGWVSGRDDEYYGIMSIKEVAETFIATVEQRAQEGEKNRIIKSNCCNAIAEVKGDTTKYCVCMDCEKPCDVHWG